MKLMNVLLAAGAASLAAAPVVAAPNAPTVSGKNEIRASSKKGKSNIVPAVIVAVVVVVAVGAGVAVAASDDDKADTSI